MTHAEYKACLRTLTDIQKRYAETETVTLTKTSRPTDSEIRSKVYRAARKIGAHHQNLGKIWEFSDAWTDVCEQLGIGDEESPKFYMTALNGYADGLDN